MASLVGWGCSTREEIISFDPNLDLVWSTDTVAFDTLLSKRRSSTKRLSIHNPNREAIQLTEIVLGKGDHSEYKVVLNGRETNQLINERILGNDSLLILVEVNVQSRNENLPYLVKDSIIIRWNTNEDHVKLIAYGQDGNVIDDRIICDERWNNDRPYILSDTVRVAPGCELVIQEGTRIYFENNAALFIQGSLKALGNSENHIVFRNARFDGIFDEVPGQWNGIYFLEGSVENEIRFSEIFNGQVGLRVGTPDDDNVPDLLVSNTEIYNMSHAGILAFTSDVAAENVLIYNCGNYLTGGFAGGNYSFTHCTFSNDPPLFVQDGPTVQFSDHIVLSDDELLTDDLSLHLTNTIIWGPAEDELRISNGGESNVTVTLISNIIKSSQEITDNFTSAEFNFPGFKDSFSNDYQLDTLAFAKDKGALAGTPIDINGDTRDDLPDIGAFERIEQD